MRRHRSSLTQDRLDAPKRDDAPEGLVGTHLAARSIQRRVMVVGSVIGIIAVFSLAGILIRHAPPTLTPP